MTKEQMGQQLAIHLQLQGVSEAAATWMFSRLRTSELHQMLQAYGLEPKGEKQ
jgi:hypothetical protein